MKKLISLILVSMLLLCSTGLTLAVAATANGTDNTTKAAAEQGTLYLVPGSYVASGAKVNNTISSGAQQLTQEQCDEIFVDNAYLCTLSVGDALPTPQSDRTDKEGNPFAFNGWWSIVDATITYFDKVPEVSAAMFLYADWRADLSQRKDPVEPVENPTVTATHYMTIKRAATGETETLVLRVGGTDVSSDTLGYGSPVQLYNGWFELSKGDVITVYTNGLGGDMDTVKAAPIVNSNGKSTVNLESAGDGSNVTADYLKAKASTTRSPATLTCIAEESRHYRIYIKFYVGGTTMAVYMEPMD